MDRASMVKTALTIYMCDGFWCPLMWSSKRKRWFYHCYTILTLILLLTFAVSQMMYILVNLKNVTELANNFLTFIPTINACCKAVNLIANRGKIIDLLRMLSNEYGEVRNERERNIQQKRERLCKWINTIITINTVATLECMVFSPFMQNFHARKLPFLSWVPYNVDTEVTFWITFGWEALSATVVGLANLANDLLAISIMMQISVQLDILTDRFFHLVESNSANAKEEMQGEKIIRNNLAHCIRHHLFLFDLADATQQCLVPTFISQMFVSLIGTCTGAYQLARSSVGSPEFTSGGLYVGCMISEAFLYCWFGNEVHLKSLEVSNGVYNMNWTSLGIDMQKNLLKVCIRARQPITFTSGPTTPLSNEVFVGILQASYSAYTVLRELGKSSTTPVTDVT